MKALDLTGKRFGRLVVLGKTGMNNIGLVLWTCQCDCGGMKTVIANKLKTGHVKSCGCLGRPSYDLQGKKFGRLTAVRKIKNTTWYCICDCGVATIAIQKVLRSGEKKSCGCLQRTDLSFLVTGKKVCSCCLKEKPINEFFKDKHSPGGFYPQCKECKKGKATLWRKSNPHYQLIYYRRNPEKGRTRTYKWRKENPVGYKKSYTKSHAIINSTVSGRLI